MTIKKIDWKAVGLSIKNGLDEIEIDRQNLPAAFDLIRENILDHLALYIDKRHMGGFRVEIESTDRKINSCLRFEGKTLCKWSI